MPLPNETWSMQVKQSLPKSNIKIKCALTVSLWVICSLERSFDSKLNSSQFRFTVAMFIKKRALFPKDRLLQIMIWNFIPQLYSFLQMNWKIILCCPSWILGWRLNNIFTSSYTFLNKQSSNTAYTTVKINHLSMNQAQKWYSRSVFLFVKIHSVPEFGFAGSIWTNAKAIPKERHNRDHKT